MPIRLKLEKAIGVFFGHLLARDCLRPVIDPFFSDTHQFVDF